jgi:hypothetical protein
MEKRQRLGKEREIMECVKDIFLNSFPYPKKAITYQLSGIIRPLYFNGARRKVSVTSFRHFSQGPFDLSPSFKITILLDYLKSLK